MKISIDIPSNPSVTEKAAKDIAEKFQSVLHYAGVFDATVEIPCTTVVSVPGRGLSPSAADLYCLALAVEQNNNGARYGNQDVRFTYTRADGVTSERYFRPLSLYGDNERVQGYDLIDRGRLKTFTVSRIRNVVLA